MKVHIDDTLTSIRPELIFLVNCWAKNVQVDIKVSDSQDGAITLGKGKDSSFTISDHLLNNDLSRLVFTDFITDETGKPDYFTSAFYLLNSTQEYTDQNPDELGRFKFSSSYQSRLRNPKQNLVQECFDEISKLARVQPKKEKTRFFLSHDIDAVNGAFLQDGFNVLKKGRIDLLLQIIFRTAIGKPDWLNIDKIMKMESEYDCKSVFFWIVNKGRVNKREENADYRFKSERIQKYFQLVEASGFENGIHKSISNESFADEFKKYGQIPISNRYHYLKYSLPEAYHDIQEAGLKLDASVGFAEEIGFRNSYGLPFNPFDLKNKKPFSFVEVPLHIMDRTFFQYKKVNTEQAGKEIFDFFEKNKENCVLSVLWHNNFFTNYKFKGYLDLYKKILAYIKENNFTTISQEEIIKKYSITS